ncbi:hypothetical protein HPB50_001282 [Hyalomma asiaticum]|uniref:Uncharacterized protein n=1 Tax=Hyalomma asiaticum TaxID=266040 RepID=A0ACB7RLC4_HYAAI|nr:hypothetical protein HPB50_001282 [Hyalomma asiaticum]
MRKLLLQIPNQHIRCDLIMEFGYTCETISTTTEDGYVLETDRVGAHKGLFGASLFAPKHNPIILVPGILSESGTWFVNFPSQSPGYILADRGFDVWAMNTREVAARGRNVNGLQAKDDRYWHFNEIGRYDLSAVIDLVLNTTGAPKVTLLAFSQGFTSSLVLLSTRPEYNDKVGLLMGYGPVANLSGVQFPFPQIIAVSDPIFLLLDPIGDSGYFYLPEAPREMMQAICDNYKEEVCSTSLIVTMISSPEEVNSGSCPSFDPLGNSSGGYEETMIASSPSAGAVVKTSLAERLRGGDCDADRVSGAHSVASSLEPVDTVVATPVAVAWELPDSNRVPRGELAQIGSSVATEAEASTDRLEARTLRRGLSQAQCGEDSPHTFEAHPLQSNFCWRRPAEEMGGPSRVSTAAELTVGARSILVDTLSYRSLCSHSLCVLAIEVSLAPGGDPTGAAGVCRWAARGCMFNFRFLVHRTARFAMYDYGLIKNLEKYGQATPPDYPVENIRAPVALFSSVGDTVADSDDVARLAAAVDRTLFFHNVVPPTNFRHMDFVLGHRSQDFLHELMLGAIDGKIPPQ